MHTYEFITPSDAITFKAASDRTAYACALVLGSGKAGCRNTDTGAEVPTLLLFAQDPEKDISGYLGATIGEYMEANGPEMAECFDSFAYVSATERRIYDDALDAITDAENLLAFKQKHEDRSRSSLSEWVAAAWKYAAKMRQAQKTQTA